MTQIQVMIEKSDNNDSNNGDSKGHMVMKKMKVNKNRYHY